MEQQTTEARYLEFLQSKAVIAQERGLGKIGKLNPILKPHQRDIVTWALKGGNRAIFASFGLGKTIMQLQLMVSILKRNKDALGLIICPLGVKHEFVKEMEQFFHLHIRYVRNDADLAEDVKEGQRYFVTNYERVRDGALNPNQFEFVSLDEASILRSFGSKTYQTFLPLFAKVPYKYVATATPAPNRFKELIHYMAFLGIMDSGQALTRFFKRNPKVAGDLTIHPHKETEFWQWLSTGATFLTKPSDLGHDDTGYDIPPLNLHQHRLPVDHSTAGFTSWGQGKLVRDAAISLREAAREKRDSLMTRIAEARRIIDASPPDQHWIIWHDLEEERRAIEKAFPEAVTVYGSQDIDDREGLIEDFSEGRTGILATKPSLAGSGCNFQYHCHSAIYLGVGYKFNDFIQSIHRLHRFLQPHAVDIHIIYTESEDAIYETLMRKWAQHDQLVANMTNIIKENGLSNARAEETMRRSIGIERQEQKGERYTCVNNDNVLELPRLADNSVDLVVTSWPFSNHYEYTPSYNDYGHNQDDAKFFEQMDFLTPEIMRTLKPGRMYCVHCKDRLLYGSVSGLGMYSVNRFSDKCAAHLEKHGFVFTGRITIDTDVVRENSQTYRLGWTENAKDGTKMGCGSPEYILMFRKLPTDLKNAYADEPVPHPKGEFQEGGTFNPNQYSRSRWQFDASGTWRSSGERFLSPDEISTLSTQTVRAIWMKFAGEHVYDYENHVRTAEILEKSGVLPASFMLLPPVIQSPWIWDDITRMRTLNTEQAKNRVEQHICPLQFDVVDRLIKRFSAPGELVLDPFAGLMTVPYRAVLAERRGYGIELSSEYWHDGLSYCRAAEIEVNSPTLFDALEMAQ